MKSTSCIIVGVQKAIVALKEIARTLETFQRKRKTDKYQQMLIVSD